MELYNYTSILMNSVGTQKFSVVVMVKRLQDGVDNAITGKWKHYRGTYIIFHWAESMLWQHVSKIEIKPFFKN